MCTAEECEKMKSALKLQDKGSSQSHTLSGGMKRKLSVGIAFSAGSKVSLAKMNTMIYMQKTKHLIQCDTENNQWRSQTVQSQAQPTQK